MSLYARQRHELWLPPDLQLTIVDTPIRQCIHCKCIRRIRGIKAHISNEQDNTAIVAIVITLIAFVVTTAQLLQALFGTAEGFWRCQPPAISHRELVCRDQAQTAFERIQIRNEI